MNTEFNKQMAVCNYYEKKAVFWMGVLFWTGLAISISLIVCRGVGLIMSVVGLVVFIPAIVRLHQFNRATNKLEEL